jgi:hypothetical protein
MLHRVSRSGLCTALVAGHVLCAAGQATAESPIDTKQDIDKHFEIASKDFGDGKVQLHSRWEGEADTAHAVHNFDCVTKTYAAVYAGDTGPDEFPLDNFDFNLNPIDETSPVAPLAQHACKKHGYPLLEW